MWDQEPTLLGYKSRTTLTISAQLNFWKKTVAFASLKIALSLLDALVYNTITSWSSK